MKTPTPAEPFTADPSTLPDGFPSNLALATRTTYVLWPEGKLQYLVFREGFDVGNDPRLNQVLSSGFDIATACASGMARIQRESKPPSDYWARLEGCTFSAAVEDGNVALQHLVMSPTGEELARADYREEAARLALHQVLVDCKDMTFEEFSMISVTAQIQRGGAGKHYGLTYSDSSGQDAVRALVHKSFRNNESARQGAAAEAAKRIALAASDPKVSPSGRRRPPGDSFPETTEAASKRFAIESLVHAVNKTLLSSPPTADIHIHELNPEDGKWNAKIILHSGRFTPAQALRFAFKEYQSAEEKQHPVEQPA